MVEGKKNSFWGGQGGDLDEKKEGVGLGVYLNRTRSRHYI